VRAVQQGRAAAHGACLSARATAQQAAASVSRHLAANAIPCPAPVKELACRLDTRESIPVGSLYDVLLTSNAMLREGCRRSDVAGQSFTIMSPYRYSHDLPGADRLRATPGLLQQGLTHGPIIPVEGRQGYLAPQPALSNSARHLASL
jgi:hypothetical protein